MTAAAGSIYSTPRDMARYVAALLGGGSGEHGSILQPDTVALMFEPHYQPDPRIPGMGLAFWRVDLGGHPAVEHQGVVPGFNSQIFLAPDDGVGVMAFTNGSRNASGWLTGETEQLLRELIGAPDARASGPTFPQHPEIWGELCGWYRPRAQRTDMMAWSMLGAGVQVSVRRGQLILRTLSPIPALYRGLQLHPDDKEDPYVFRIDLSKYGLGTVQGGVQSRPFRSDDGSPPRRAFAVSREAPRTTAWLPARQEADMSITAAAELWRMSATELAEAIRSRQVSSQEVDRGAPSADRGGQRLDQRRGHRSWPSRR